VGPRELAKNHLLGLKAVGANQLAVESALRTGGPSLSTDENRLGAASTDCGDFCGE
jgi:hypothetical protein